ncbi:MAG TPA: sulfotransferase [Actinomycetota bacterium]|nr:sulfotransferase [Actinomycetota bacterium]
MTARNPYVFAGGCPRSGTTLLRQMLHHHPSLAIANDSYFIPKCLSKEAGDTNPRLTLELVECVLDHPRFNRLGLPSSVVDRAAQGAGTYVEFVSRLYTEFAIAHGKRLAGEKTPDYIRRIRLLHALFPWARFLHVIRDGRDVALSVLDWATKDGRARGPSRSPIWREEPVGATALWWTRFVDKGRRDGAGLGAERYLEIRFERLVAEPRAALRDVLFFLELPFVEESLQYHQGKAPRKRWGSTASVSLPPTPGLRDWRTQMSQRDVELFEGLAGEVLDDLGYERAFPTISPDIAAIADRCRDRWLAERPRRRASTR